jgi:ATP-binding cassette subfamily C protein
MKYETVLQQNEEDCGAACLGTIAKHYGKLFTINRLRDLVGTRQNGTTLLGLKQGAESLGFNARGVTASSAILERINEVPLPAIIHWQGNHWVVLYGKEKNKYIIADPSVGIRYLDQESLLNSWSDSVMLLLQPDDNRFFEQEDEKEKITGFKRVFNYTVRQKKLISQILIFNSFLGILALAYPFLIQILTDDVLVRGDFQLLIRISLAVAVMYFIRSVLELAQSNLIAHFALGLQLGLTFDFCRQILRLPLSYYETRRSGEISSRLDDIQQINQLIGQIFVRLPIQGFVGIISLLIMFIYSTKLGILAIVIAAIMTFSTIGFLPRLQRRIRQLLVLRAENQGVLVETFKGALTLKTISAYPQVWEELQHRFSRQTNFSLNTIEIGIINTTFSNLVANLGNIIILGFGSNLVINEELSIGMLLAFNSMNSNFTLLINSLIDVVNDFAQAKTATQRIMEVIDADIEISTSEGMKPVAEIPASEDIICEQINFHYVGRLELLKNFTVTIPGGKVTALIGKSGCGKSTLAKLIAGLYQLQSGNIRFGAYNQQDINLDCLRQQVVLIPQETHFWSRSIIDNFRLGSPNLNFEKIVKVCQLTGADEFISQLPNKYQTILGEFGANLSGGQRQRLAIARAIISEPSILILDESTTALDPVSEMEVLNNILEFRQGKTTILISHHQRVINKADWIIMLDKGQLKCEGLREILAQKQGEHLEFLSF